MGRMGFGEVGLLGKQYIMYHYRSTVKNSEANILGYKERNREVDAYY